MPYLVQGNCSHCGACCRREGHVISDNPMIEPHEDRCKFYTDNLDTGTRFGHCLVLQASQPRNARDRENNRITDEQVAWFEANCPNYPSPIELFRVVDGGADVELLFDLPTSCAFSVVEVP